jgi:hypothetical protein
MRLTSIDVVTSAYSEALNISLNPGPYESKYEIRQVAGLDAEEITPKFYGTGTSAESFYDMGMKPRDIVLGIVLNPNFENGESYSDLRDALYRAISASRTGGVQLVFYDGPKVIAGINGFITKFETDHMTRRPSVNLTINCEDPMIRGINPIQWAYGTPEHPGINPIRVPDGESTAPHGFKFQLTCTTATPTLTIADQLFFPTWTFQVSPTGGFLVGDVLHFSSDFSDRFLYVVRGATTIHLIDKVTPESVWPIIFPGNNVFFIDDITKFTWTGYLQYYPTYWGV